jgi:hypothetical protein
VTARSRSNSNGLGFSAGAAARRDMPGSSPTYRGETPLPQQYQYREKSSAVVGKGVKMAVSLIRFSAWTGSAPNPVVAMPFWNSRRIMFQNGRYEFNIFKYKVIFFYYSIMAYMPLKIVAAFFSANFICLYANILN